MARAAECCARGDRHGMRAALAPYRFEPFAWSGYVIVIVVEWLREHSIELPRNGMPALRQPCAPLSPATESVCPSPASPSGFHPFPVLIRNSNLRIALPIQASAARVPLPVFGFAPQNEFEHRIGADPVAPATSPVSRQIRYRRSARKIKIQQEYTSGFPATRHFLASWRNRNAC
jgi:hypothetical protein